MRCSLEITDVQDAGYAVANAIARENLGLKHTVVADCVNPLAITRTYWQRVAEEAGTGYQNIEVVCSDPRIHQARVEARQADIVGHVLPTWQAAVSRDYAPWHDSHIQIDTAFCTPEQSLAELLAHLRRA
jgi:predicted kinase